jgi:hypothetical protein
MVYLKRDCHVLLNAIVPFPNVGINAASVTGMDMLFASNLLKMR